MAHVWKKKNGKIIKLSQTSLLKTLKAAKTWLLLDGNEFTVAKKPSWAKEQGLLKTDFTSLATQNSLRIYGCAMHARELKNKMNRCKNHYRGKFSEEKSRTAMFHSKRVLLFFPRCASFVRRKRTRLQTSKQRNVRERVSYYYHYYYEVLVYRYAKLYVLWTTNK